MTTSPLSYRLSFQQAVHEIAELVVAGLKGDRSELDGLNEQQDCVYLKNNDGTLTWANEAYRSFFSADGSPIGRHAKAFLDPTIIDTSKHTDALILSGSDHLECDHTGTAADGQPYLLRTYKRSLQPFKQPGFAILGVTRPLRKLDNDQSDPRAALARLAQSFRDLDERDREICRLIALGRSSAEIGEELDMTGRNVEIRRKNGFTVLGVTKPVELVRVLVRLQERGYLDLGL